MRHDQRSTSQKLYDKVPVANGVQTIFIHAIKTQLLGYKMTVYREGRPCQSTRTERQYINALIAVFESVNIALQHRHISQQMMREQNRLRTLQMRISGYNRIQIILRLPD